ncbi:Uncharacterized sugar kinase ydjH [uncultured Flavonifractor sp.]|nr:Uncharacterized sugar kinase ydjH [uncultured Flavonifractor sp.]
MGFVSGAGHANVDLIYGGLPRLPLEGEEQFSTSFTIQLGGGVPATMVLLGRLGIDARVQTYLGEDMFSDFARKMLRESGVSPLNLYKEHGIPLCVTTAMLTENDRTFCSFNQWPTVTDEILEQIYQASRGAKVVLMCPKGFAPVYKKLKEEGTILVFDMGWDDELSMEKYGEYIQMADYYTPNRKEALKVTGADTPEEAAEFLERYFEHVIVKLDAEGCLIREQGRSRVIPTIPEFVHRDSTGAGDAFLAGLIYGLYHDRPFDECVLLGNLTGGKCVTGVGCLAAWFNEQELLDMEKRYHYLLDSRSQ